jgi:MSHA biogenesis protein MshI
MGILSIFHSSKKGGKNRYLVGICLLDDSACLICVDSKESTITENIKVTDCGSSEDALTQILKQSQSKGIVSLGLANQSYQFLDVDKPSVDENELNQVLKWSLKDLISYDTADVVVDYIEKPAQVIGHEKVYAVAGQKKKLKSYVDNLSSNIGGLKQISVFETLIRNLVPASDQAKLIMFQLPGKEVILQIIQNEHIYFSRRLRGYNRFCDYTAEEIQMGAADALILEIQRSLDYFESQLKQNPVTSISLNIAHDEKETVCEVLATGLNLQVEWIEHEEFTPIEMLAKSACSELSRYLETDEKLR